MKRWLWIIGAAFVILHQPDGRPIQVNPDHVDYVSAANQSEYPRAGSVLSVNGSARIAVREKPDEAAQILGGK